MDEMLAAEERRKDRVADTDCIKLPREMSLQHFPKFVLSIEWRNIIFVASRFAFIIFTMAFVRGVSVGIDELRLWRASFVEQSTAIRMAVQLQGRDISKGLHALDVNSSVLIDRFDTVSTHLRGQMTDAAKTVAIASKEERKEIVQAIQSSATESQKDTPTVVVPDVQVVPVPQAAAPAIEQPSQKQEQLTPPVPQPSPTNPTQEPAVQRKGNLFKRLWHPLRRIF